MQESPFEDDFRVAIVGAGGYGRVALDVLLAGGYGDWIVGFYDDSHAMLPKEVRGFPLLGDVWMLKSLLSVEPVYVIVAITDNVARLQVANSIRALGGKFMVALHPMSYASPAGKVGDGTVIAAGAVVHPDAEIGSHCMVGPRAVVDRDAVIGAGCWLSAGAVVGPGARLGARVVLGVNSSVERKASVEGDSQVSAHGCVPPAGGV
ncbi:MAG: hypothetical protein H0V53_09535 [Rubrobacter sp.]|nr:hypothetical protein [Rubrobacter sp.]